VGVREAEGAGEGGVVTGGASEYGIHTQGDSMEEIRRNVREAVDCYFDEGMERPGIIRLHFGPDEVLVPGSCLATSAGAS